MGEEGHWGGEGRRKTEGKRELGAVRTGKGVDSRVCDEERGSLKEWEEQVNQ